MSREPTVIATDSGATCAAPPPTARRAWTRAKRIAAHVLRTLVSACPFFACWLVPHLPHRGPVDPDAALLVLAVFESLRLRIAGGDRPKHPFPFT
jgi:hypothetical protein